jgi:hypothetical protein
MRRRSRSEIRLTRHRWATSQQPRMLCGKAATHLHTRTSLQSPRPPSHGLLGHAEALLVALGADEAEWRGLVDACSDPGTFLTATGKHLGGASVAKKQAMLMEEALKPAPIWSDRIPQRNEHYTGNDAVIEGGAVGLCEWRGVTRDDERRDDTGGCSTGGEAADDDSIYRVSQTRERRARDLRERERVRVRGTKFCQGCVVCLCLLLVRMT